MIVLPHPPHHFFQCFLPVFAEAFGAEANLEGADFYAVPGEGIEFLPVKAHAFKRAQDYFAMLGGDGLDARPGCHDFYFDRIQQVIDFRGWGAKAVSEFTGYSLYLLDRIKIHQFLVKSQTGKKVGYIVFGDIGRQWEVDGGGGQL